MKKILVTLTTTLITTAVLVACNASTDDNDSSVGKAVCTSGNNWQSVNIGMTASELESRLGKPATITSTTAGTTYTYERCRAGLFVKTAATTTTEAEYTVIYFGGSVIFSNNKGVSAINSPKLILNYLWLVSTICTITQTITMGLVVLLFVAVQPIHSDKYHFTKKFLANHLKNQTHALWV